MFDAGHVQGGGGGKVEAIGGRGEEEDRGFQRTAHISPQETQVSPFGGSQPQIQTVDQGPSE